MWFCSGPGSGCVEGPGGGGGGQSDWFVSGSLEGTAGPPADLRSVCVCFSPPHD